MNEPRPRNLDNDIIAAIATAQGLGGIGIVRLSGPGCIALADIVFAARDGHALVDKAAYALAYGRVVDSSEGQAIDEALVAIMRAPRSYTTEDVVEINVHGGPESLRRTLDLVLRAGARMAEPGEFTRRAFLNGRIDLAQAEAVVDIIEARTKRAGAIAARQLTGQLSARLGEIEGDVEAALAELEAAVDFSDEDIEEPPREKILTSLEKAAKSVDTLLANAGDGELVRAGVRLAIIGRPNVGKSSLLNALLRRDRAIVTPVPGTTRDVLEEAIAIDGVPFVLMDTAGIRDTEDHVESAGVARSRRSMAEADVVALVIDAAVGFGAEDMTLLSEAGDAPTLVVANKADLVGGRRHDSLAVDNGPPIIYVSAKTGAGLDDFNAACVAAAFGGRVLATDDILVSNARHAHALRQASAALARAMSTLGEGLSEEFAAGEVRTALASIGEITGRDVSAEILDRIFERFCVGK